MPTFAELLINEIEERQILDLAEVALNQAEWCKTNNPTSTTLWMDEADSLNEIAQCIAEWDEEGLAEQLRDLDANALAILRGMLSTEPDNDPSCESLDPRDR